MDKQGKKISVKVNGIERTLKGEEPFAWLLPEQEEKVIHFDEKIRKKKVLDSQKRYIFFVIFAMCIGIGFGLGLLQLVQSSSTEKSELKETTVKPLDVYVQQNGVFTDVNGAEQLAEQLRGEGSPVVILQDDKNLVISAVATREEQLPQKEGTYKKPLTIPGAEIKSSERETVLFIRQFVESLLTTDESNWTKLKEQGDTLAKVKEFSENSHLYKAIETAYQVITAQKGQRNEETEQALLTCLQQYQNYILSVKK